MHDCCWSVGGSALMNADGPVKQISSQPSFLLLFREEDLGEFARFAECLCNGG